MATAPTAGKIYILEAAGDLGAKTNWITTGAGDPDTIDLDQFTEGTYYCQIPLPKGAKNRAHTGLFVEDTGGGGMSYVFRSERKGYQNLLRGLQTSLANAMLIDKFLMSDRHTAGATATFNDYYLVMYFGVNNHWLFTDNNNTQKSYCLGVVPNFDISWNGTSDYLNFLVDINWRSVWQ